MTPSQIDRNLRPWASSDIVILGAGRFARMMAKYIESDSLSKVAAFAVEQEFLKESTIDGREVISLNMLSAVYPPGRVRLLTGIGYHSMNTLRARLHRWGKDNQYTFATFLCSDTRMIIRKDVTVGEDCILLEGNTIQPGASLNSGVILCSGNLVSHDVQIGEHTFIASGVMIGGGVRIGARCFIGMGAVVRDGIHVADDTFVGAGVTLLKSTQPRDVFIGNHPHPMRNVPAHVLHGFLVGQ